MRIPHPKAVIASKEVDFEETAVMVHRFSIMRRSLLFLVTSAVICSLMPATSAVAQFTEHKITASDGDPNDRFGESVAIDGTTAVIGAFRDDDAGSDAGAAYVFDLIGDTWTQTAKLIPDDGTILPGIFENSLFGGASDISNDVIVVGAVDGRENGIKTGEAYVFEKGEPGNWTQLQRLVAFDGGLNDLYGASVATNGDYVFVGALDHDHSFLGNAGAVYIYKRNSDADIKWDFFQKLTPADAEAGDSFGWSVDVDQNRAIIGARDDDDISENAGSAYIYEFNGIEWAQVDKIHASDGNPEDSFGEIVAIKGDQVIIGARDVDTQVENVGAAYIFERQNDGSWNQTAKLFSSDGAAEDLFGNAVTIDGDYAAVSTRKKDALTGAVYLFQRFGDSWTEISKLDPAGLGAGDLFGQAVNMSGTTLISGTKGDDDEGLDAGAAHIFELASTDRGALVALYNATNGPGWSRKNNWLSDAPIGTWYGVKTNTDGRVTEVDLEGNMLLGELPVAIGGLPFLKRLNLRNNNLSGNIPEQIGELLLLEVLDLGTNEFDSEIPASFEQLVNLKNLFLDNNAFTGTIPDALSQISSLEVLYLHNNDFSGIVPEKLTGVESLRMLRLQGNQLVDLPNFGIKPNGLSNLNNLVVFDNQFTFEDLEPNVNVNGFEYNPQAKVGEIRTLSIAQNNPLVLQIEVGGSANVYQWKKDGAPIPGANADTYLVPAVSTDNAGVYTLEVTNDIVSSLTIVSEPITVNVIPVVSFATNLSSIHVVPPVLSAANGSLDATLVGSTLTLSGVFEQLAFPFGSAALHLGASGVNTDPTFELVVNESGNQFVIDENDNVFDLTNDQLIALQNGLFYVSIETESGSIADPLLPELRGQLYQVPNSAPDAVTISSPPDGTDINLGDAGDIEIKWNTVGDPDGHPVDYLWAFSRDRDFEETLTLVEGVFRTGGENSFSISHENLDAFLALQGVGQGESITIYHLVASSDGSLFSASEVVSMNLIRSTTNQAPRVENPVVDFTYVLEDGPASIALNEVFLDPDGDALQFEAGSSNEQVAQINIVDNALVITPIGLGTTTISLSASDTFNAEADDSFALTINSRPAVIGEISNQTLIITDPPFVQALPGLFSDADPLLFSAVSESPEVALAELDGDGVNLRISPVSIGISTITVTATDDQGAEASIIFQVTVQSDVISPPLTVAEGINISFGNPTLSASYRLVALPGDVNLPLANAVNGLAEEDWIAFHDNGQDVDNRETYFERYAASAKFTFRPGRGFWLLSKLNWSRSDSRPTVTLNSEGQYAIPLQPGWNIISNPFDIDVPWQAVTQLNNVSQQLYRWSGTYTNSPVFSSASTGNAFYFFNSDNLTELKIPYLEATTSNTVREQLPALSLFVVSESDTLSSIRVGRHQQAAAGFDRHDQIAPPGAFEKTSIRLVRKDVPSGSRQRLLTEEYLPDVQSGFKYEISLKASPNEPLLLKVAGHDNFENHQQIFLIDRKLAKRYDLRKNPSLTFWPKSKTQDFVLLIGDDAYIEAEQATILPAELTLLPNYPNPFAQSTTVEFAVPEPSQIRIVVYDALGREVSRLADGMFDAGHHQLVWDGTNNAGTQLSSGIYFYRLQLQETQIVRSMILRR